MATQTCPSYYCGDEWDDITSALCPERKNGGIAFAILLRCGILDADIVSDSDPNALDLAKVQALIDGNDAKALPFIQVTIDAPSPVTANVYDPCNPEQTINYDRTLTIVDPNVNEVRRKFWSSVNSANLFANGGMFLYECDAERWTWIPVSMSIEGGRVSPENNGELQRFELVAKWRDPDDAPIMEGTTFVPSDLVY
jgi:hypothetical protein